MKLKTLAVPALAGGLFVGGMVAPPEWQQTVNGKLNEVTGGKIGAPAVAEKKKDKVPGPFTFDQIERPIPLAKGQTLGAAMGMFASAEEATKRTAEVANKGYKVQLIKVWSGDGPVWYMPLAGKYETDGEADDSAALIRKILGTEPPVQVILIPKPPEPKSAS
ncbi:MAG: SPOR domain-containing protein [Gammaproteobacteria bacterium]